MDNREPTKFFITLTRMLNAVCRPKHSWVDAIGMSIASLLAYDGRWFNFIMFVLAWSTMSTLMGVVAKDRTKRINEFYERMRANNRMSQFTRRK